MCYKAFSGNSTLHQYFFATVMVLFIVWSKHNYTLLLNNKIYLINVDHKNKQEITQCISTFNHTQYTSRKLHMHTHTHARVHTHTHVDTYTHQGTITKSPAPSSKPFHFSILSWSLRHKYWWLSMSQGHYSVF